MPRRNDEAMLSAAARKFNGPASGTHDTKRGISHTQGSLRRQELPAYEAAAEFISKVSGELDDLLPRLAESRRPLHTLEKLEQAEQRRQDACMICWSNAARFAAMTH